MNPVLPHTSKVQQEYQNTSNTSGFTLLEVIVTIVIIGVLAAIGYPLFSKWVPAYKLKGAVQILYADMQKAKIHAIKTNRDVTFSFTVDAGCNGTTSYTFTDDDGDVVSSVSFDSGVCIYESDFANGTSGFDSRGLQTDAVPALHTVKMKHTRHTKLYEITQDIAGILKIK